MANITLYYVDGISRENTPYFDIIAHQDAFFAEHVVATPSDGFYVPFLNNKIVLSITDVSFSTKVNYLSLYFNSKHFYYFITDVVYISENEVEISIELDSVQTFMFNIVYHDGIVERKFIDRYKSATVINRDYIRENVSNGVWKEPIYNYITLSDYVTYVIRYNPVPTGITQSTRTFIQSWVSPSGEIVSDVGYTNFVITDREWSVFDHIEYNGGTANISKYPLETIVEALGTDQYVFDIVMIPFIPFDEVTVVKENNVTKLSLDMTFTPGGNNMFLQEPQNAQSITMGGVLGDGQCVRPHVSWKAYSNPFTVCLRNTQIEEKFDPMYMPQMVDNNYMSINFGERSYCASYPLHRNTALTYYGLYAADPKTGNRMYGISESQNEKTFSEGGIVVTQTPFHLTMFNDTWKSWYAQNRATIPMAMANFAVQCIVSGVGTSTVSQLASSKSIESAGKDISKKRSADWDNRLLTTRSRKYDKTFKESSYSERSTQSTHMPNPHSLLDVATSALNAFLAPDSVKQTSVITEDVASGGARHVMYKMEVLDFEQCAYYFHQYGYLVNERKLDVSHVYLLNDFVSRYYFDYVKFQYIDIDLNFMCAGSMLEDLQERLTSGIRIWYMNHGKMCDYYYDNVERSVL